MYSSQRIYIREQDVADGHLQLQGRQAGNGAQYSKTGLVHDDAALPDGAGARVDQAAVLGAAGAYAVDEGASLGSDGAHGGKPEDDKERVQGEDSEDVVELFEAGDLLGQKGVGDDDPCE
jgi:hypothetical protein